MQTARKSLRATARTSVSTTAAAVIERAALPAPRRRRRMCDGTAVRATNGSTQWTNTGRDATHPRRAAIGARTASARQVHENERSLVARASGGDRGAFGSLYERYVDAIHRYIAVKVGQREDVEDLTSRTFLRAWDSIADGGWSDRPFGPWLFRIAHNLIVDCYRARRTTVPLDDASWEIERKHARDQASPERMADASLTAARVRHALGRLTEDQQQVIVLRFFEGLSAGEVAVIIGKREGAVRALQFRALSLLAAMLHHERACA
jgi:RNA polymerase sigma factor (sigma-70 family)